MESWDGKLVVRRRDVNNGEERVVNPVGVAASFVVQASVPVRPVAQTCGVGTVPVPDRLVERHRRSEHVLRLVTPDKPAGWKMQ